MAGMDRVGVRELRQNLSVYLRRVEAGETLEVTDRGRPVALLTPRPAAGVLGRLVAAGLARPPTAAGPMGEALRRPGPGLGAALAQMRDEEE